MKKIISLCSVILVLAIVVTAFASCGDNKGKEDTTKAPESNDAVFTAEIGANETVVKKGEEVYQTLKYPINSRNTFDFEYAKEHYEFKDMNFDGVLDFYIAISSTDGVIEYYCWLFNDTSKQFEYSAMLSALNNISVDSDKQCIITNIKIGDGTKLVVYRWVDGVLQVEKDYGEEPDGAPEDITKSAQENAIGVTVKPATTTDKNNKEETTKKNNPSSVDKGNDNTTKPNKPANTTTTSPSKNIIVVETGNANNAGWY